MIGNIGGAVLIAAASDAWSPRARWASLVVSASVGLCAVGGLVNERTAMRGGLGFLVIAIWTIVVGLAMTSVPAR